jgi:hypothetical protein
MDEQNPQRPKIEVDLAESVIRIFDLAAAKGYDVVGAIVEKLAFPPNPQIRNLVANVARRKEPC